MARPHGNGTKCPHCQTTCKTVKSEQVTRTVRHITYLCPECNHVFVAQLEAVRTLAPSSQPHDEVSIPGAA